MGVIITSLRPEENHPIQGDPIKTKRHNPFNFVNGNFYMMHEGAAGVTYAH